MTHQSFFHSGWSSFCSCLRAHDILDHTLRTNKLAGSDRALPRNTTASARRLRITNACRELILCVKTATSVSFQLQNACLNWPAISFVLEFYKSHEKSRFSSITCTSYLWRRCSLQLWTERLQWRARQRESPDSCILANTSETFSVCTNIAHGHSKKLNGFTATSFQKFSGEQHAQTFQPSN